MVEAFFDELPDGICISDARGSILYLNPAAERLLDLSNPRTQGRKLCEVLCGRLAVDGAPECATTCELLRPGSTAEAVTFRGNYGPREIATWNGSGVHRRAIWKNLRVRCLKASPSLIGEGKHLTLIEDVTVDFELERQKEDWRQMIAHDLRSPLTSIYATIRLFQESQDTDQPLPAESGELINAAERSSRKMLELITLYLDVAKLDAGVAEIHNAPIRLADAVRGEIAAQEAVARGKKQEIILTVPSEIVVEADPDLLSRVVQNVLDNAVKFTPWGGRVECSARVQGGQAELSIKDSGPGIAAEELPLLFDRYHQARARRAGKIQGTGLGLTFCREALKIMRGSIVVGSKLSEGTVFTIRLPLASPEKVPVSAVAS
jgi:signal transduction histidine kinase